jgi:uncharacterized membrane protein YjjP (DUF1212 family)
MNAKPKSPTLKDASKSLRNWAKKRNRGDESIVIHNHIQDVIARQKYLVKLCRALMQYGAPTHRLEEYLRYASRVLEIKGQFLYIPGCMLISFDDTVTHTTEVKIVRCAQGVDLGKLTDCHDIYKETLHDLISVNEATERLDALFEKEARFNPWVLVFFYGVASAVVGPFAFQARLIDMPIAFLLGSLLGIMQQVLAPKSELYSNVFEITATVLTSFLARWFGSMGAGNVFCFSALAQSAIALILPGYLVLSGALELQSKNIVAGSIRMVYAIIYSLFLGFGVTVGSALYGGIDANATNATTCEDPIPGYWKFWFVPAFTAALAICNQAKWRHMPVMIAIAFAGYIVNYFSALRFASNVQVAQALGALAIGILGNLYSRFLQRVSAAVLIPAIFVQVPSGLAASGSLISGLASANQIVQNTTAPVNATSNYNGSGIPGASGVDVNTVVFNVAYATIQIAIGITVGLFLSALIIYPFGKKRSGLFSF